MKIIKAIPLVLDYAKPGRSKPPVYLNDHYFTTGLTLAWLAMALVVCLMVARSFAGI